MQDCLERPPLLATQGTPADLKCVREMSEIQAVQLLT
jgi:hypothetical protein